MWRDGNKIVIKSLRKQLDYVIVHEQMENGVAINNNLCVIRYINNL